MALVKAPTGGGEFSGENLPEFEPIALVLTEFKRLEPTGKFDNEKVRFQLVWNVENDPTDRKVWDFMSVTLGEMPNGQPSKLRSLINALAGRGKSEPIAAVDDETGAFYLTDADHADGTIAPGVRVIVRGTQEADKKGAKTDAGDPITYYRISTYHPAKKNTTAVTKPLAAVHAASDF